VDDGSTDQFQAAVQPYQSRICVLSQPKRGVAAARNRAIEQARGEFLAFLDADDLWYADKIARQVNWLECHPRAALVHTAFRFTNTGGLPIVPQPTCYGAKAQGLCTPALLEHNTILLSSVLLRRAALGAERFRTEFEPCEDRDLWLRISRQWPIGYLDECLTAYRLHDSNCSAQGQRAIRARLKVLQNFQREETTVGLKAVARRQWEKEARRLGHIVYERGERIQARSLFAAAGIDADRDTLVRYLATFLPTAIYTPIRSVWRFVHGRSSNPHRLWSSGRFWGSCTQNVLKEPAGR
jgi:glycosyltransferase involved in cell wall biosynthesis